MSRYPPTTPRSSCVLAALCLAAGLFAVSGCEDSSTEPEEGTVGTTYVAGVSGGDLLTYTLDTSALTYSYEIVESEFGLTGQTGSGTLTQNADGTYSPSGEPATLVVLPNTLIVGMVQLPVGAGNTDMLFAGVPQITTDYTPSGVAGTYNYITYECDEPLSGGACTAGYQVFYGTFQVDAGGTWQSCDRGDLTDPVSNPCSGTPLSGTWSDQGNGILAASVGGTVMASAMLLPSASGGKVLIVDLKDRPAASAGPGILVGVRQVSLSGMDISGTYRYVSTEGYFGEAQVPDPNTPGISDSYQLTETTPAGGQQTVNGTFVRDDPWTGWLTTGDGTMVLVLPDDGVWLYMLPSENTWFGIGGG